MTESLPSPRISAAEFVFHTTLALERASPALWQKDKVSEERRQILSQYLTQWYGEHAANPGTPEAAAMLERVARGIDGLYRSTQTPVAALMNGMLGESRATEADLQQAADFPAPERVEAPAPHQPGRFERLQYQLQDGATQVKTQLQERLSGTKSAIKERLPALKRNRDTTLLVLMLAASKLMTPSGNDLSPLLPSPIPESPDPAAYAASEAERAAEWQENYEFYFRKKTNPPTPYGGGLAQYASEAYEDSQGAWRIGFGTAIAGMNKADMLEKAGIDPHRAKQISIGEEQANRLAHLDAVEYATGISGTLDKTLQDRLVAETHRDDPGRLADIQAIGSFGQTRQQNEPRLERDPSPGRVQKAAPEPQAAKAPRTPAAAPEKIQQATRQPHEKKPETHSERHISQRAGFPHAKTPSLSKAARQAHLKPNVNLGVRTNPRAYVSRAMVDHFAKRLDALSPHKPGDTDHPFYQNTAELLEKLEGVRLKKYPDIAGHVTIGGGHLLKHKDHPNDPEPRRITDAVLGKGWYDRCMAGEAISMQQALALTKHHIVEKEKALMSRKRIGPEVWNGLSEKQRAGLVSLAFNCGPGGLNQGICKPLRAGDFKKAGARITARINRLSAWRNRRLLEGEYVADQHLAYTVEDAKMVFKKEVRELKPHTTLAFEVPNTEYLTHLLDHVSLGKHVALAQVAGTDSVIVARPGQDESEFAHLSTAQAASRYPQQFAPANGGPGR